MKGVSSRMQLVDPDVLGRETYLMALSRTDARSNELR